MQKLQGVGLSGKNDSTIEFSSLRIENPPCTWHSWLWTTPEGQTIAREIVEKCIPQWQSGP